MKRWISIQAKPAVLHIHTARQHKVRLKQATRMLLSSALRDFGNEVRQVEQRGVDEAHLLVPQSNSKLRSSNDRSPRSEVTELRPDR